MDEAQGYMLTTSCTDCLRRNTDGVTCEAFPGGIPILIMVGAIQHDTPYDLEGDGDGGLTRITESELQAVTNLLPV